MNSILGPTEIAGVILYPTIGLTPEREDTGIVNAVKAEQDTAAVPQVARRNPAPFSFLCDFCAKVCPQQSSRPEIRQAEMIRLDADMRFGLLCENKQGAKVVIPAICVRFTFFIHIWFRNYCSLS
jgi:hypothetical protein